MFWLIMASLTVIFIGVIASVIRDLFMFVYADARRHKNG